MRIPLALLLSAVGGYVDAVGFLALQGLFTAHVTGNFVTIGAALTQGSTGAIAKLLALPVFCLAVVLTRLASERLAGRGVVVLPRLLWAQCALLAVGAAAAVRLHPFAVADGWDAILVGMAFVAAMAVQNAAHRMHLANAPPSTLMTGTTTQIMIDLADRLAGRGGTGLPRRAMVPGVLAFAAGCGCGAVLYATVGPWAFVPPAVLILLAACDAQAGASARA